MANSQLLDKQYRIPPDILRNIKRAKILYPTSDGIRRANHLLSGVVTYQSMKRIKHDLENIVNDKIQYSLAGGELMLSFVNRMLSNDRSAVSREKQTKQDIGTPTVKDLNPDGINYNLNEVKKEQIKNSLCVVVNGNNKILLLKRTEAKDYWGSGQWGLVGGRIEKGEKPEEACRREVTEETGLVLGKFKKRFNIQRDNNETEYIFVSRYNGSDTDIELNEEHTNYGWFGADEIKELNTVPQLMEYLILTFKKY